MPRGDKSKYPENKREHIEDSYEERGVPEEEERRAWATTIEPPLLSGIISLPGDCRASRGSTHWGFFVEPLWSCQVSGTGEDAMKLSSLFLAVPAALLVLGSGAASAGEAISDAGAFACVADKWAETEPEKAHKWVDYVGRCVGTLPRLRLGRSLSEAVLNSDPSGLGGYIVLLDGRTMLRNKHTTLSNQQRKPSFKFGTSDEFGSVILLLSNKDVQLAGSQSLTQGQMTHSLLPKKNGASARQPKLPSIVREKPTS